MYETPGRPEGGAGTRRRHPGQVRLRRYLVTEVVTETEAGPRHEVRVQREPVSDAEIDAVLTAPDREDELIGQSRTGPITMTGSVMNATRGTEPAQFGAAPTTPVASTLAGHLAGGPGRRPVALRERPVPARTLFVPLFGVLAAAYFMLARCRHDTTALYRADGPTAACAGRRCWSLDPNSSPRGIYECPVPRGSEATTRSGCASAIDSPARPRLGPAVDGA